MCGGVILVSCLFFPVDPVSGAMSLDPSYGILSWLNSG